MYERFAQFVDVQSLTTKLLAYMPNILLAVLLVIVFVIINAIIQKGAKTVLFRARTSPHAQNVLLRFIKYGVFVFAFLTVADQLEINVSSLIAGVGIAGLALSFAAQDTIANIISGIAIILDKPFQEGDWISIGDMHASVTEIRLRTTVLTGFDNETVVVPNKQLSQERIINYTLTPKIRIRVSIGIAYKEDMQKARDIMLESLKGDERILPDPAPMVVVTGLGDSSVDMQLRFWTDDPLQKYPLTWEYTEKCKQALDRAGIEIPFPHMQLFLEKTDAIEMLAKEKR
jgi:small conductance mechanosensitive channel